MRRRKRRPRWRRGTTLVEASLVMTLLCMVTLGALQYGWFFYCQHTVTNAARQGARVAATLNGTFADGKAALDYALGPYLLGLASPAPDVLPATVDGRAAVQGVVTIPAASVALMPISFLPVPDCRARVTMAKEGPS